ncbi:hypothetical protein L1856_08715 [Streptomyces sp. Tue 6430]|nr:hypothetical protein [Streptomyces sp. Tue 6430]
MSSDGGRGGREAGLWWALPDLLSNHTRAQFEERAQAAREKDGGTDVEAFVPPMQETHDRILRQADEHGVDTGAVPDGSTPLRHREFLRGYSNALHNLATALRQAGRSRSRCVSPHAPRPSPRAWTTPIGCRSRS